MIRILTYNVHSCRGTDGRLSPERVTAVIAAARPDIVALQEIDVGRARTGGLDQAHAIARGLDMNFHFHPAFQVEEERYGEAVLSARPMRLVKAGPLPNLPGRRLKEPRGALWVAIDLGGGTELHVVNTHLGLLSRERVIQAEALLAGGWLSHPACHSVPLVLLGDFNAVPRSRAYARLTRRLRDAQGNAPAHRPLPTFPGRWPLLRIDHILLSPGLDVLRAEVRRGPMERVASDHLPVLAELRIRGVPGS